MAKKLSKNKAEKILHDKQVKGRPLTEKQRKFFGAVASGAIPKAQIGRAVSDNTRKPINVPLSKQELEENKYVKAIMHQYDKESYLSPRNESTNPIITAKEDKKRKTLYKENQRQQLYDETVDPFIKLGEEFATPMQAIGLFPHPVTQTIGRIGDLFVASASARNAKENLEEGNIGGAIINTAFGAFPFMRKGKNLFKQQGGSVESRMGGLTDKGFNYNGAWGGQFAMGGMLPGVQGHMYARTGAPSEGKYAKKTLPSAAEGYEVLPDPTDPERKYKLSAVVQSAKDILNPVLRSKNPKMYDEWMQGRIDAVRSGNLQKYESERPLSIYLTPDEIKNTLSKQNKGYYDEYLTALKELNMFKELGKDSYAGQIEGEKPLGSLLYGSRLSTAPVNLGVDEPSGKGFRYSYNPSTGEYKKETFKNGGMMSYYQHGLDFKPKTISKKGSKIKKDNDGYWNPENWGKPVEIDSNEITMQGVYEPLLGVSDTGDTQMMFPGQDYTFEGNSVTEYPVAQNGINQLDAQPNKKLDQLLNFTNFNDMANAKKGKKVPQAQAGLSRLQPLASESTSLPRGMDPRAKAQLAKEIELINKRKKEEEVAEKMKNFPVVKPASRPIDSEATRRKNKAAAARLGLDYNEKTGAVSSPFSEKTDEALRKLSERTVERGVEGALYAASLPARMVQSMYKPNYTAQQALMGQASDASFVEEMFSDPLNYPTFGMKSLLTKVLPKAAGLLPLFKVLPQDPQAVGLYQQYLDNVRSILGRADVMRQAKDKGNILAQSYGRFDPAYGRAFQEPSILPETIESIAESLISVDPRTRTISSAQKEYMDKLRRFTINSQSVSTAVSNPQTSRTIYNFTPEETLDFLVERAKTLGISPVDAVPVIRQHFRNMPQITDVAIMREFGNTLESPIAEPLAAVRMARDLVPDIQKRISTLFNSAREARPQVNISDEFLRSAPRQRLGDAKSIIGSMGLGGNDYRPISSSIMSPRVLNDVFDFWTGSLKTKVQDWLDDPNKLNLAMSKVERDSKTPKEVQDLMKLWNKDREEIINILRNPSIHNDLFRTAGFTDEEIQEAARTAMSPAAVAEREKRMSSQVRTGLNETFEPIIVSDRAGKQYTTPFTFNKGRLFTGSKSTSSDSWPLFLSAAGDETYRGVSDIVPLEGGYEGIYGHTNDFGGGTKYAETIIDLLTGREAMPDFTIRRAAIPIVRDMVRNMLEVRPLNFEIDRFNNPVIVKKGPNRQREAIPHPSLPTTNLPSAYHDPTRGIEGETFKPEIGIVPKGLVPRTDVEKLPKPEYFDTLEEYEDAMNKYRYGKWFQGKGPKAKLRKGGTLPKAQIGRSVSESTSLPRNMDPRMRAFVEEDMRRVEQMKRNEETKRAIANQPSLKSARVDNRSDREKERDAISRQRQEAIRNSPLARTMSGYTPSGNNPGAGEIGAQTFVDMMPITGQIMSTNRLYNQLAGRNPYGFGEDGVDNVLGGLGMLGDMFSMGLPNAFSIRNTPAQAFGRIDEGLSPSRKALYQASESTSAAPKPAEKVHRINHLKELVAMKNEGVDLVDFFRNLDWTGDGRDLWNAVKKYDVDVLTGGRELAPGKDAISSGKRAWTKKNLDLEGNRVIVEKQKQKYATPETILIDDLEANVNRFREAGGHAILHTDTKSTLKKLREHMAKNPNHKVYMDLDGVLVDLEGGVDRFRGKKKHGGYVPQAQVGTQQKLFTPENIGAGIQAGSDIGKAIQTVMRATEQRKIAKQTGALAPLVAQAAATRDVDTPNMLARQIQANRPEYNLVDQTNAGVNPFGTGYDVLSMAQNGAMIGGNPTEIQNTYAPTTLYDDLGYEPLDESSRVKRFIGGGNVRKALIGDTIGLIGKGANLAGDIVAGIMDIGTRRMNRQSQQQLGQAAFQSGMQGLLGGQMGAYMKHGGDVGDEYKWVSHSWQPQVITKFGEHNVKDLLRPDPMMNTLRAGGHLKEYTAPSERAMSTERPQFAMGGELNTHWGGDMELASYNPYMPGSGETHVARGLYHSESDGRGNTGIGMSYGGNMVEVENGEPVVEMQEGGSVQDKSAVVFGNLKIPSYVASELGDKDAKGKMFKSYVNDLTKKEVKQNKLIDKALEIIENYDTNSPFDILSLSTAKAMLTGADMKLQEIAMKKMTAAGAQQAMHETADEMGFDVEKFINRGKIVQAKNGANTAQSGTYTPKTLKANLETPKFMQPVDFDKPLYTPQGIPQLGDVIEDRYSVTGVVPEDLSFRSEFYNTPERKKGKTKGKGEMKAWDIAQKAYNELLPFIRPLNQMELQPEQLAGEMMALATNVLEPVQAQFYQPMLEARAPKMTAQEALNRNQADFNALARQIGNNPAALAVLSAQKQAADRQAIAQMEAFNIQQEMATRNRNISTLNDASLKNLAAVDLQYQRQAGARSSTKAQAQTALNSIASKIGQNKLENLTSGVMQNMYNYRFGPKGRIINYNPLLDVEIPTVTDKKQARNGSIVKAIKNL